jgi:hypothetical protein
METKPPFVFVDSAFNVVSVHIVQQSIDGRGTGIVTVKARYQIADEPCIIVRSSQ